MSDMQARGYRWRDASHNASHGYLLPALFSILDEIGGERRCFDLGCGNGSVARAVSLRGWSVTGVDPSDEGIVQARRAYPDLALHQAEADPGLAERFGRFPVVYSLEVVEHVYAPRVFARTLAALTQPEGVAIVSTPYHGYWKNLALAVTGRMDAHFTALWDHGHIKFWSFSTLRALLSEAGFTRVEFRRVGRIPPLAKSMIAISRHR
jgi:2-polyprenyl-3-methyl-5-hydroxy-6-metoxy-1,4-benzoquinol methylase